jgi:hypothetical protein
MVHTNIGGNGQNDILTNNTFSESYHTVRTVYNNLSDLETVVDNITEINSILSNITNINVVGNNITNVNAVGNNINNLNTVKDNLTNINTVSTNITDVNTVNDNITDLLLIKNNLTDINTISDNISNVNNVGGNINTLLSNMGAINLVNSNLNTIQGIADVINELNGRYINNITTLRATEPTYSNQFVYLIGHTTSGIGGGLFYYDITDTTSLDNNGTVVVTNLGKRWKRILENNETTVEHFGIPKDKNSTMTLYNLILTGHKFKVPKVLYTLAGVASQWASKNKFPICFMGDSTTDGRVSTTNGVTAVPNSAYNEYRLVNGAVPDNIVYDHDELEVPNAYTSILQRMARNFYDSTTLRVYNAGYRGKALQDGWASTNIHNAIFGNTAYADVKMVILNFGINDAGYASVETLRSRVYNHTKAIILDCYYRGIQPVLMGTNTTAVPTEAGSGHNKEQVIIVDQVKKHLAQEFGIDFIDMNNEFMKFLTNSTFPYSTDFLLPDNYHGNDIYHMKQAEIVFCKYIAKDLIVMLDKGDKFVDVSMPMKKSNILESQMSTATYTRGQNQLRRNIVISPAEHDSYENTSVIEFWVWNECPKMSFIYSGVTQPNVNTALITDVTKLPQLRAISQPFTALDYSLKNIYSGVLPSFVGTNTVIRTDTNYFIGNLDYGLNIISVNIPQGASAHRVATNFLTSVGMYVGSFEFIENHANSVPKIALNTDNGVSQTVGHIKNALEKTGPLFAFSQAPSATNYFKVISKEDIKGSNTYGLRRIGDSVEMLVSFNTSVDGWGVILSTTKVDNSSTNAGTGFNKYSDIMAGNSLVAFLNSGTLRIASVTTAGSVSSAGSIDTGITSSTISNKVITFKFTLTSLTEMTWEILSETGSSLANGTLSSTLVSDYASGFVGGIFNNRSISTTGNLKIDVFQIREVYV